MNIVTKDRERLVRMQKDLIDKMDKLTRKGDREHSEQICQEVVHDYKELNRNSKMYDNWEKESKHLGTDSYEMPKKS